MIKGTRHDVSSVLIPIIYGLLAIAVAMLVCWSGQYPFGSETMSHLYRGDSVYNAILDGNIFPLYDSMWYNGIEVLRFCEPISVYFIAFCQFVAGGDPTDGYMVFVGIVYFLSAFSWHIIGKKHNRVFLSFLLGTIWFFMPNNLYELFFIGNLPRALCMVIIPITFSYVYDYLCEEKSSYLPKIILLFICIELCDFEYSIMLVVSLIVCLFIFGLAYHRWKNVLKVLVVVGISYMITAFWSVSYMVATSDISNAEIMSRYFQDIFKTLNPVERIISINSYFYFGLAAFIVMIFGIIFGKKKTAPVFWSAVLLFISTVSSMYPIMSIMPGSDYLLMGQYISLALCLVFYGLILWKSLKKPLQIILCVLLVIDIIPSLNLVYGSMSGVPISERFDEQNEATLISKAKEVCQQRMAYFDGEELESMGAYLVSKYDNGKATSLGYEWDSAVTRDNIINLNKALSCGSYTYFFDRCKELGNDTILVKLTEIDMVEHPVEMLDEAALKLGYEVVATSEFYRLYDMDIDYSWGTKTKYPGIGMGMNASAVAFSIPGVKEVHSDNLNDYTFEELAEYELVYLAGFSYDNKKKAEDLILKLSEAGVQVVILADGIPANKVTQERSFLGVLCNGITFNNGYPILDTVNGKFDCDYFPQGFENWETVYVNGLDNVMGIVREGDLELEFYGTVKNDNIVVIGLNALYYYSLTKDESMGKLLSETITLPMGVLPERELVPIDIQYNNNSLTITTDENNVNTTLAFHEMFNSNENVKHENNLLYVDSGTTYIWMEYPYIYYGLAITLLGIILAFVFCIVQWSKSRRILKEAAIYDEQRKEVNNDIKEELEFIATMQDETDMVAEDMMEKESEIEYEEAVEEEPETEFEEAVEEESEIVSEETLKEERGIVCDESVQNVIDKNGHAPIKYVQKVKPDIKVTVVDNKKKVIKKSANKKKNSEKDTLVGLGAAATVALLSLSVLLKNKKDK